jgi:uncharacterized membrane protein
MHYALPIFLVALTIPAFFLAGRDGFAPFGWPQLGLRILVALILLSSASVHLLRPSFFVAAIPPAFPAPYTLVILSGLCEAAGAIGLFVTATRRAAAVCLAILMVAVFPANIYIAGRTIGALHMPGVPVRGAMQMVFIALILLAGFGLPRLRGMRP